MEATNPLATFLLSTYPEPRISLCWPNKLYFLASGLAFVTCIVWCLSASEWREVLQAKGKHCKPNMSIFRPCWMIQGAFRQKSYHTYLTVHLVFWPVTLRYVEAPESSRRNKDTGDSSENNAAWKKVFHPVGNGNVWNAYRWNTLVFIEHNLQNATNLPQTV